MGQRFVVEADVFSEYEPVVAGVLLHRREGEKKWDESPMLVVGEDRQRGEFAVEELGSYHYTLEAWIDHFATWRRALVRKAEAEIDVSVELQVGCRPRARGRFASFGRRRQTADVMPPPGWPLIPDRVERIRLALSDDLAALMARHPRPQPGDPLSRT